MKKIKFILSLCLSTLCVFNTPINVSAKENVTNEPVITYNELTDYENKETGEYFKWEDSKERKNVKNFSFKIRYQVESSSFVISGTNLKVYINNTYFQHSAGHNVSMTSKSHKFTVDVFKSSLGIFAPANKAIFYAPNASKDYVSLGGGFTKGNKYWIRVTNNDDLKDDVYLVGSGYIDAF